MKQTKNRVSQYTWNPYDCKYLGCLNIHETHVTANNSTNNNVVFFFVLDLKIVFYNNY